MDRRGIVTEIIASKETKTVLAERWELLLQWVRDYRQALAEDAEAPTPGENWVMAIPGDYYCLDDLEFPSRTWHRPLVHPLGCFGLPGELVPLLPCRELTPDEQVTCDAALLSVVHDIETNDNARIPRIVPRPCREFNVARFYRALRRRLAQDDGDEIVERAWLSVMKPQSQRAMHIDLRGFKATKSRNLLYDLLVDELREGVSISRRHGKDQPKNLRRMLKRKAEDPKKPRPELKQIAKAVIIVEHRKCKLDIPESRITFDAPKT